MKPLHTRNRVVGLLGGSFNPAHAGHLHISVHALKKLKLDEVWWLVSPHNPLKAKNSLADYKVRLDSAHKIATHAHIYVSDIEQRRGLRYTYETIAYLQRRYPGTHFVWLMGADNLVQFHRWQKSAWLLSHIPIIVFDRAPYSHAAKQALSHQRMRKFLIKDNAINRLWQAPCLYFMHMKRDAHSSTAIRKSLGKPEILGHNKIMKQVV